MPGTHLLAVALLIGAGVLPVADTDPPTGPLLAVVASARVGTRPPARPPVARRAPARPLAGKVVVVDPGHQLGNARFGRQVNALVDARGLRKACNTTGTATNAGYPEATFDWDVAAVVVRRLRALGATVVLTRRTNSVREWGPCIDVRGRIGDAGYRGTRRTADLKLSIHGDGSAPGDHGFHVIVATGAPRKAASLRYADLTRAALERAGFARSSYVGGGSALSVRDDLGTLNWSTMPTVMVELGNMRDPGDAAQMTSLRGQRAYGRALTAAARRFLTRD